MSEVAVSEALGDIIESTGLFYYVTMKNYERDLEVKAKKKQRILNSSEKCDINKNLGMHIETIFDYSRVVQKISSKHLSIDSYADLFNYLARIDLNYLMGMAYPLNTYFPCNLKQGNFAWVSKSETGHYRYFSKGSQGETISFDLVDLLEIYYGLPTPQTVEKLINDFKIKFMESEWSIQQHKKYVKNLDIIKTIREDRGALYPELFDMIGKHLSLLEFMNLIGGFNVKKREFSFDNQSVFFASSSYLAERYSDYSIASVNKIINLFAALGLIDKIPLDSIPPRLKHESQKYSKQNQTSSLINYFIINSMNDVLSMANERAKTMIEHNIRYSNISRENLGIVFGYELADSIYRQNVDNPYRRVAYDYKVLVENNFYALLKKKGYVTKMDLVNTEIAGIGIDEKKKIVEKLWRSILINNGFAYIRTTLELKKKFKLKSMEYIAVPRLQEI